MAGSCWYKVLKIIRLLNCKHQGSEAVAQKNRKIKISKLNLKRKQGKQSQFIISEHEAFTVQLAVLNENPGSLAG